MSEGASGVAGGYDRKYRRADYFGYRSWMYRPYVRAMARRAKLRRGASVLDAGCGQGLFSSLFSSLGFETLGVDLSAEGIRSAVASFGSSSTSFRVGDIRSLESSNKFDCVFCRSCSLYNAANLENSRVTTDALLGLLRPGGMLIFAYYSRLRPGRASPSWIYHSLAAVRQHFRHYPRSRVYFTLRMDSMVLGKLSLSLAFSWVCRVVSMTTGVGGDIVAFVQKPL